MENYNNNGGNFQPRNNNVNNNKGNNNNYGVRPEVVNNGNSCATTAPCTGKAGFNPVQLVKDNPVASAATAIGVAVGGFAIYKIATRGFNPKKWFGKKEEKKPAAEQPAAAAAEEGKK